MIIGVRERVTESGISLSTENWVPLPSATVHTIPPHSDNQSDKATYSLDEDFAVSETEVFFHCHEIISTSGKVHSWISQQNEEWKNDGDDDANKSDD